MAIELKFTKIVDDTTWGFRLAGGADCDIPLTVVKVNEGGIADRAGLQVDDVITRINDKPIGKLTHSEVHDVLLATGNQFSMAVRRGEMMTEVQDDDQSNEEVSNIMEASLQKSTIHIQSKQEQTSTLEVSEEIQTRVSSKSSITDEKIAEAISGEAEVLPEQNVLGVNFNKVDLSESTVLKALKEESTETKIDLTNKKFSTFLQKPKRARIMPKKKEDEGPQYPPYRVIIKKQKKKDTEVKEEATEDSSALLASEKATDEVSEGAVGEFINEQVEEDINQTQQNYQSDADEETDEKPDNEETPSEEAPDETVDEEVNAFTKEQELETEKADEPLTLEEQLAQVQQQLQALSQLPSTIQVTLNAVTNQLAKIVRATHIHDEETAAMSEEETAELEGETAESTLATMEEVAESSDVEEETKFETELSDNSEQELDHDIQEDVEIEGDVNENEPEEHREKEPTEEELEARRIESEKAAQHEREEEFYQRRLEQRPTHPLTPLQRPIILPGGRRWSQPDDARPRPKMKSKMTDEKISETLDTFSEIIVGHTKGINFLKYQPPPKNLDYLQHSEVFKLLHDDDPPRKGIAARPEIVSSEQDYYTRESFH